MSQVDFLSLPQVDENRERWFFSPTAGVFCANSFAGDAYGAGGMLLGLLLCFCIVSCTAATQAGIGNAEALVLTCVLGFLDLECFGSAIPGAFTTFGVTRVMPEGADVVSTSAGCQGAV